VVVVVQGAQVVRILVPYIRGVKGRRDEGSLGMGLSIVPYGNCNTQ